MNLNEGNWNNFKIKDIFDVVYGVNLELNACEETIRDDPDAVNFVSRTQSNNGVSAYVKRIPGIKPQSAGIITVAGGGSVLSTFVQPKSFYSGRDLYLLIPKKEHQTMSLHAKLFICTIISSNKYKYNYGRQANRTLPDIIIRLPQTSEGMPDYEYMDKYIKSLHSKVMTTSNKVQAPIKDLQEKKWAYFKIPELFEVKAGRYYSDDITEEGRTPYISASDNNNGVGKKIDRRPDFKANRITIGKIGATTYYQSEAFCATSDVNVLIPKFDMNKYIGLFISTVINFSENYKWAYGRQCRVNDTERIKIKLPVDNFNEPDWQFMEDYIKSLPYGDRI